MCQTPCCAFCYERLSSGDGMHCERCAKRLYCSKRCQAADWAHGHRLWCGACGELDHDYAIEPRPGKGLALVALRPFKKCDTVMVERPLLRTPHRSPPDAGLSSSEAAALWALTPARGSMLTKIYNNQMSCRADASFRESGVFVTMARVNHSCLPNAEHYYSERDGVKRLIACRAIASGDEICISYVDLQEGNATERRTQLRAKYSFDCDCAACTSPALAAQIGKLAQLHAAIPQLAQECATLADAMAAGDRMLELLDELQISELMFLRVYYDLFQVALLDAKTRPQAECYIRLAADAAAHVLGEQEPQTQRYRALAADPTQHRNHALHG